MNIAFVQLASWGDCINSTLMFEPIKNAYPGCNIDVHTTTMYESAFHNNPHVGKIIAHEANSKSQAFDLCNVVPQQVKAQKYDKVLLPMPIMHQDRTSKRHPEFGHNIICTFMRVLEEEGIDYAWPVKTILRLTRDEVAGVDYWLKARSLPSTGRVHGGSERWVLMETHGESGQTFWTHHWTLAAGRHMLARPDTRLFISRKDRTQEIVQLEREFKNRAFWVGDLSIRQCAELFNRCGAFLSVSSGLSNACGTDHCRTDVTWVEAVNSPSVTSAPVRTEGKLFWYQNDIAKYVGLLASVGL